MNVTVEFVTLSVIHVLNECRTYADQTQLLSQPPVPFSYNFNDAGNLKLIVSFFINNQAEV